MKPLLTVKGLKTHFFTDNGTVRSVDDVDFIVNESETVGIVGESGCGKSVTALSLMQLINSSNGKIVEGSIVFQGQDLVKLNEAQLRKIRGNDIAMIFQDPMSSLNPVYTIGNQIIETLRLHTSLNRKEAKARCLEVLAQVGIPEPEKKFKAYPHQLSGGMRQRIMIAIALSCNPKIIIADEPTTALDVTIQAQILELIQKLKVEEKTSIIMITHDLGVVSEVCDRVIVMYAGQVIEEADARVIFATPQHPYTTALLKALPLLDEEKEWLETIPGNVPIPSEMPVGCKFAPRCSYSMERCLSEVPELMKISDGHSSRCFLVEEVNNETINISGPGTKIATALA